MAGKRNSLKRLSCVSQSASNSIDMKARKRIEELFELTDEIINAYNEINDKYVSQIYRKYEQLKEVNKKLQDTLKRHHCTGCQCTTKSTTNEEEAEEEEDDESSSEEEEDESGDDDDDDDDDEQPTNSALPSSTTNSIVTRSKKNNPFIIPDIEETQNFDANDSRFNKNPTDDEVDQTSMDTDENATEQKDPLESSEDNYDGEEVDGEENGMACLPIALQIVIRNKAAKNKNAKAYLLEIPRYPALCEYLRDRSSTSFDHRPSEKQVRPLIENHLSKDSILDAKVRMRLRDELREIHRSYLRTFMTDPHAVGAKTMLNHKPRLPVKKSPM